MIGERIEEIIINQVRSVLGNDKSLDLTCGIIETDSIAEVIEKLCILHTRIWYLEDAIGSTNDDSEIAELKRKLDVCFKQKRPKYVQGINRMIDNAIKEGKSLTEDSVKYYKGFENT